MMVGSLVRSPCLAPPFGVDDVADIIGLFATIGHVSDGFISFAAALARVVAVFSSHSGGNQEGMTG